MRLTELLGHGMVGVIGQIVRLHAHAAPALNLTVDGRAVTAQAGDSVLVAVLTHGHQLGRSDAGGGPRAGFCLMGACQDCWMWTDTGERLRACTTRAADGMRLLTAPPPTWLADDA